MNSTYIIVNILAAGIYVFGALLLWPSRNNMPVWLGVAPFIVSIVIPALVVNYEEEFSQAAIELYTLTNLVGSLSLFFGMALGGIFFRSWGKSAFRPCMPNEYSRLVVIRLQWLMLICCSTLVFCFIWMRVLPIFADDPLLAKFFRGQYRERYIQIAFFYRFAQASLAAVLPISIAAMFEKRSSKLFVLNVLAIVLFSLALTRGTAFQGLLIVIAVALGTSKIRLLFLIGSLTVVYCFGSMFFYFLGLRGAGDFNLWQEIAWGAPDIKDQIQFLSFFDLAGSPYTYGATFFGGLIPGNFVYNPAIFTLSIVNQTDDISEVASGGFRLNPGIYGYIAYSWLGAIFVPFFSGILTSAYVKRLRQGFSGGLTSRVSALQAYLVVYSFLINFYNFSYSALLAVAAVWFVLRGVGFNRIFRFGSRSVDVHAL